MKEDRFTQLALEAVLCKDAQKKEAILQEVYRIENERIKARMDEERRARIRRHFQTLLTKKETAKLPMTEEPMTEEEERELAFQWGMTRDFQEFMKIGRKLFPEMSEEDLVKAFGLPLEDSQSK